MPPATPPPHIVTADEFVAAAASAIEARILTGTLKGPMGIQTIESLIKFPLIQKHLPPALIPAVEAYLKTPQASSTISNARTVANATVTWIKNGNVHVGQVGLTHSQTALAASSAFRAVKHADPPTSGPFLALMGSLAASDDGVVIVIILGIIASAAWDGIKWLTSTVDCPSNGFYVGGTCIVVVPGTDSVWGSLIVNPSSGAGGDSGGGGGGGIRKIDDGDDTDLEEN